MRKVLVQRLQPLSMYYKKRYPLMRKIVYVYEGVFEIDESIRGEKEFIKMLFNKFGPGHYQILGWKKYPIRLRDKETRKPITKDKIFPLFKLALVIVEDNGRGRFLYNRMKRMFRTWEKLEHEHDFYG